jgi:hypothetical protein
MIGGGGRIRSVLRRAQWLLVPLLVLGIAEACVRLTADRVPTWYGAAERLSASRPVRVLFVGSSRVQAAILPAAFEQALAERGRPGVTSLNLGRGYSTDAEHYLGLRNLLTAQAENLRGVTVFAEALGGFPFPTRWDTAPWAMSEQPWMLVDLLRASDLPRFWVWSGLDFDSRLHISVRVLLRRLALFNRRERVREQWLSEVVPSLRHGLRAAAPAPVLGDDLQGMGHRTSIRTDPAALAAARAIARRIGEEMSRWQEPMRPWDRTIAEELVRLVRQVGGRVVFFEPPQSEVFLQGYRTRVRQEDAVAFAQQAREWGACVVRPAFAYSDEDLPDLWHLRPERVTEFTRAVALTWLERCESVR